MAISIYSWRREEHHYGLEGHFEKLDGDVAVKDGHLICKGDHYDLQVYDL